LHVQIVAVKVTTGTIFDVRKRTQCLGQGLRNSAAWDAQKSCVLKIDGRCFVSADLSLQCFLQPYRYIIGGAVNRDARIHKPPKEYSEILHQFCIVEPQMKHKVLSGRVASVSLTISYIISLSGSTKSGMALWDLTQNKP